MGLGVRIRHVVADGDAARIRVLDDRDRRFGEVVCAAQGRVGIHKVVVRHLLAAQLRGLGDTAAGGVDVERGGLVRVLAVAQGLLQFRLDLETLMPVVGRWALAGEPGCHGGVVRCGVGERLDGQFAAQLEGGAPCSDGFEDPRVVGRRDDDRDVGVVLRGGPYHRRPPDVDLLDDVVARRTGCDRLDERVQVRDDEFERLDTERRQLGFMRSEAEVGEKPGMDARVEGANPAVEVLGKPSDARHIRHRVAGIPDPARRRSGGDDLHTGPDECGRELEEPGLVAHRDQRAPHWNEVAFTVETRVVTGSAHARASSLRSMYPLAMSSTA